jgi:hypothetical protein
VIDHKAIEADQVNKAMKRGKEREAGLKGLEQSEMKGK